MIVRARNDAAGDGTIADLGAAVAPHVAAQTADRIVLVLVAAAVLLAIGSSRAKGSML